MMKGTDGMMADVDRWLVRAALLGGAAAVLATGLLWLTLTRPVAVAAVLGRFF